MWCALAKFDKVGFLEQIWQKFRGGYCECSYAPCMIGYGLFEICIVILVRISELFFFYQ